MHKRLSQLKALSKEEWRVLLSSLLLLPLVALALRMKGYKWTRAFLQKRIPEIQNPTPETVILPANSPDNLEVAQSVARMVTVAANHGPYRANCLKQSLATWWLLKRRDITAELNIGVSKDAGDFNAHAWVEYMGNILVDADDIGERYSTFGPQ